MTTPGDLPAWLAGPVDFNGDAATNSADVALLEAAAALYAQPAPQATYYEGPWDDIELP
ncbi:MAG: hypothetical protein IBJ10_04965 [Phycisphaerales bacterium]|nr:hypothetical protein [Phycisphaerales bacterium]